MSVMSMPSPLRGRHLVLGISGGIAAYKSCEFLRRLLDEGASVQVVMTEAATRFVSEATFQALSGRPVFTDSWDGRVVHAMPHIALSREADGIVVAPASADFLARLANGQTPDLLSLLCSARECPLWVAPAMNRQMWENPANQDNLTRLKAHGVHIWGPGSGAQACGEIGDGRMLEPSELLTHLRSALSGAPPAGEPPVRGLLHGRRVLVTAGPTYEAIDPVRGITNRSSGRMGFALAQACAQAGAETLLISGPVSLSTPVGIERISVESGQDMFDAVREALSHWSPQDIFFGVAAVADWRPSQTSASKLKKGSGASLQNLAWVENPDILSHVSHLPAPQRPFTVGFAAETDARADLLSHLPAKRERKGADLLIGNRVQDSLGGSHTELWLQHADSQEPLCTEGPLEKNEAARALIRWLAPRLPALRDQA